MDRHAVIYGVAGTRLTDSEKQIFSSAPPWGIILFARNFSTAQELKTLIREIKDFFEDRCFPILIDQEGGRVARIKPPLMAAYPPVNIYGKLYQNHPQQAIQMAFWGGTLLAADLKGFGININCAPCLDLGLPSQSDIIGDRAFSDAPETVTQLAMAMMEGFVQGGVLPVIKHLPGHGRAQVDSHHDLPIIEDSIAVLAATDFLPFQKVSRAPRLFMGMTGHLLYPQIDATYPSTLSQKVISHIRDEIGFKGVLMSDDISMQALSGDIKVRAMAALQAGCDLILHCNGEYEEMRQLSEIIPVLEKASAKRVNSIAQQLKDIDTHAIYYVKIEKEWAEGMKDVFPQARSRL